MALQPDSVDQAESAKFQTEFEEFQEKNREQKEAWKKQNPEAAKRLEEEEDWDGIFEDETVRELKTIFQGQSQMNEVMRDLHRKMDEIIGRQERALSVLTNIQNNGVRAVGGDRRRGSGRLHRWRGLRGLGLWACCGADLCLDRRGSRRCFRARRPV